MLIIVIIILIIVIPIFFIMIIKLIVVTHNVDFKHEHSAHYSGHSNSELQQDPRARIWQAVGANSATWWPGTYVNVNTEWPRGGRSPLAKCG